MDKIRITSREVAQVGTPRSPGDHSYPRPSKTPIIGILAGIAALCAVALVIVFLFARPGSSGISSVWDFEKQQRMAINRHLASSPEIRQMIQTIHGPTVTYKDAAIKQIKATTFDGSDSAGKNGDNVSELAFVVSYRWEGLIEKNGYTDIYYALDTQRNTIKTTQMVESNALINLVDEEWWGNLGYGLGILLFGE